MSTSSTKIVLLQRLDTDHAAVCAVILEPHAAGDFGENGVALPAAGVHPGADPPTALAHDDGAAGHDVAVVRLDAEPLGVGIAPVAGAALSFFVSHSLESLEKNIFDPHSGT